MVTSFVREQEEETRRAAAASQAKQGQWMNWHGVETRKISWRELWAMDTNHIHFIMRATYDVLPTPQVQAEGGSQTKRMCIRTVSLILYSIIVFQECWKKYIQMNVVQYCDLVKFAFFTDLAGGQYFGLKKNMAICFVREISFIVTRVKFAFSQIWLGARLLS